MNDGHAERIARSEDWQRAIEARDVDAPSTFLADDLARVIVHPARAIVPRSDVATAWRDLEGPAAPLDPAGGGDDAGLTV